MADAQTTIESIYKADLVIGEDAQTKIDFETADEIHFDVNNVELLNLTGAKISGSGISTGSFGNLMVGGGSFTSTSLATAIASSGDITGVTAGTGLTGGGDDGAVTLNVIGGDGITANANDVAITAAQTTITSILAADVKIGEDDQTKIDFETADEIHFYAANVEQVYLADNIFGPQSDSDVDLGTTGVRWKDAFIDTITTTGAITVGGDLTVNGTTTTISTDQLTVSESLIFLASGSSENNADAGILIQSSSVAGKGSALYHDISSERWSVAKTVDIDDVAITPLQHVVTVRTHNDSPADGEYGVGEMHIDLNENDGAGVGTIYIRTS